MDLGIDQIREEAIRISRELLGAKSVVDAIVDVGSGPEGEPVLFVRIVVTNKLKLESTLELTYDLYTKLSAFLEERGDNRRPSFSYVRKNELKILKHAHD